MVEQQSEAYPMVGGKGEYSYAKNSNFQKAEAEGSKDSLIATISENLDLQNGITRFRIADLGCSIGPTTFYVVKNIIEAVKEKYKGEGQRVQIPEFHVFFNDHLGNDFNALFSNFPLERQYFAAGVPGSFLGRLFPKASIDFIYSSNSIHWLSEVPEELSIANSPAYNRGRIFYENAPVEVCDSYSSKFAKDMESFLDARVEELIPGGLMALLIPGRIDGIALSKSSCSLFVMLESCLLDLVKEGIVSEETIDLFNLPLYFPSSEELKIIVQKNGCFDIVKLETFQRKCGPVQTKNEVRAASEGMFKKYFGIETLNKLYDRYEEKVVGLPSVTAKERIPTAILIILKRKS